MILRIMMLVGGLALSTLLAGCSSGSSGVTTEEFLNEIEEQAAQQSPAAEDKASLPPAGQSLKKAPVLELSAPKLDMGLISNKENTSGEIKVRNAGDADLEIKRVQVSCDCTVAELEKKDLAPGEEATLKIAFNPFKIPDFEAARFVLLLSNDPNHPQIQVPVYAKIEPEYEVLPREVDLGSVPKGESAKAVVAVRQLGEGFLELKKVYPAGRLPEIAFSFTKRPEETWQVPGKAEYEITVVLSEDAQVGPVEGKFYIETNCARVRRLPCPISAEVTSFYKVLPRRVVFGGLRPGATREKVASVTAEGAVTVSDIQSESADLVITARPGEEGNAVLFDLQAAPDAAPGRKDIKVRFKVASEGKVAEEYLRVSGLVLKPPATSQQS